MKLSYIDEKPCDKYYDYIIKTYGAEGEFNPIDVFEDLYSTHADVQWLLIHCKLFQTNEMLEYYKSKNPPYYSFKYLIAILEFAQTKEMLEYYLSLNPSPDDLEILRDNCEFARKEISSFKCLLYKFFNKKIKYENKVK